jgi:hypothetical protein
VRFNRPDPAADHALIRAAALAGAPHCRQPYFERISGADLQFLFDRYDHQVFEGTLRSALGDAPISFRLSKRMTRTAGTTTQYHPRRFEIAISSHLLYDNFGPEDRDVAVCGLPAPDRLTALQRIFEHELVHLAELLAFGDSNCQARRFVGMARDLFGHRESHHQLITRAERAHHQGLSPGTWVRFWHEGRRHRGVINRITKRATVLVPDPRGQRYSDGTHYMKCYVPLDQLEATEPP